LYNFRVDEETFNKLVGANLKVSLDGLHVTGSLGMIKLLMSKGYKLQATINLEKTIKFNEDLEPAPVEKGGKKPVEKKGGKNVKEQPKKLTP
jgi:hypothetical protein